MLCTYDVDPAFAVWLGAQAFLSGQRSLGWHAQGVWISMRGTAELLPKCTHAFDVFSDMHCAHLDNFGGFWRQYRDTNPLCLASHLLDGQDCLLRWLLRHANHSASVRLRNRSVSIPRCVGRVALVMYSFLFRPMAECLGPAHIANLGFPYLYIIPLAFLSLRLQLCVS